MSAFPDARQRHRQLIDATLPGLRDAVLSHHSAAVVHGIELPHAVPSRVRVIRTRSSRAESPLETRSRLMMWRHHLPMPVLQREVLDRNGHLLARLDFAWEEEMLYGECDGQVKYGVLLAKGQTPSGAVMQEKRRANDLATLGWREIRWDDHDVRYPTVLCRRIEDALRRGIPGAA